MAAIVLQSALNTPASGGEERVMYPIHRWGLLRAMIKKDRWGNFARNTGVPDSVLLMWDLLIHIFLVLWRLAEKLSQLDKLT